MVAMSDFFSFYQRVGPSGTGAGENRPAGSPREPLARREAVDERQVLTVAQLTAQIERALRGGLPSTLYVRGEVSNFKHHGASGHVYFTLKDAQACVDCVMFRSDATRLKFDPGDGMELLATGRIGVFPQRGRYQLYVTRLEPIGQGALELAFQQLRAKLAAEGLFDAGRKLGLPKYPRRVVLITSRQTAALQDMLKVLRRYGWVKVLVYHVPVQGDGAGEAIAGAIRCVSKWGSTAGGRARTAGSLREPLVRLEEGDGDISPDLILLARGGGSLEDLWAFNEEVVARAMADCRVPIITGIGHEVDVSIADLVADYHAHTPTEAAQVAMHHWRAVAELIDASGDRLERGVRTVVLQARQRLTAVERDEAFRRPMDRVNQLRQLMDHHERALRLGMNRRLSGLGRRLQGLAERLERQRPEAVAGRLRQRLAEAEGRLYRAAGVRLRVLREKVGALAAELHERHPRHVVRMGGERVAWLSQRLEHAMRQGQAHRREQVETLAAHLNAVGPEQVLRRGYTITTLKKTGAVLRDPAQVKGGERLVTRMADGQVESVAEDPVQLPLFE
jgi:exodeoxyribonuclease VII large subunit